MATQVLPNTVYISPDVGADFGSRGFVNFFVDDRKCVIRAEDHENHFKSDGIYSKILQCSKESVIIDIRNPNLCPPAKRRGGWMYVYCHKGWESVTIEYGDIKEVIKLIGHSRFQRG